MEVHTRGSHILRKVCSSSELDQVVAHLWRQLKASPLERRWHIHRALNALRFFQPVLHNNIWIDKVPPSFCFEEYEFADVMYIEFGFVDPDRYPFEEAKATLLHWLSERDEDKEIYLASFPEHLYKEGIFSEFEILEHIPCRCYLITDRVPTERLPSGFREIPLRPSDVRRIVDAWQYSFGEITVQTLEKLWSSEVNSYEVLNDSDEPVAQILWSRGIMEHLSVDSRYRRLGIGKALLTSFMKRLQDLGCMPLLEAVVNNNVARAMFEKIGFECPTYSRYLKMRRRK